MPESDVGHLFAICRAAAVTEVEDALTAALQPLHPELMFSGSFTLPLSPTGSDPPTHFGASSGITDEDLYLLLQELPAHAGDVQIWLGSKPDHDPEGVVVITDPAQASGDLQLERWASIDVCARAVGLRRVITSPF